MHVIIFHSMGMLYTYLYILKKTINILLILYSILFCLYFVNYKNKFILLDIYDI